MTSPADLEAWNRELRSGDLQRTAAAAVAAADDRSRPEFDYVITITDKWWRPVGDPGGDLLEASGTDPRNMVPSATMRLKGASEHIGHLMGCRTSLVGVIVEVDGQESAFYVDVHDYEYTKGAWTSVSNCLGIWDVLNYMTIFPMWYFPLIAQPISHAVFIGSLVTVIENMIAECALRIQGGIWEFINNLTSLNFDMRAWFGTLLQSNGNIFEMLKTPVYVVRTNPFTDTSPLVAKTVRMQSCGAVIAELTQAYGVDVDVSLWRPGMPQPDNWANLTQVTYVVTVKDRSQVEGPTKTVLDSIIRTVVDLEGSLLGNALDPLLNPEGKYAPQGVYIAPALGVNFVEPYVIIEAPDPGDDSAVVSVKISDHTPKGWRQIIGGRAPKWLNDIINATMSWILDSLMIVIGFTGVPSNLLDGFMNDAFLAFAQADHYRRRSDMGPYHPAMEVFTPTNSSPYNIEGLFAFVNALYQSRGYTSAQVTIRVGPGESFRWRRDIFRGGLASLVYMGRTKMLTDYVENVMWRITPKERELVAQIGDGKADEPPLAKHQRFITGLQESFAVLTLAPQS